MLSTTSLAPVFNFLQDTHIPEQVKEVDAVGLFTNPWFLVPFIGFIGYHLYKQAWRDLIIITLLVAVWWISGTEYMHTLVIGDELQVKKILPVLFGGAAVLGFIIYLIFGRSD